MRGCGKIALLMESLEQGVACGVWAMLTAIPPRLSVFERREP